MTPVYRGSPARELTCLVMLPFSIESPGENLDRRGRPPSFL